MVNKDDMVIQRTYTRRYQAILFLISDSPIAFVDLQLCWSVVRGNVAVLQKCDCVGGEQAATSIAFHCWHRQPHNKQLAFTSSHMASDQWDQSLTGTSTPEITHLTSTQHLLATKDGTLLNH